MRTRALIGIVGAAAVAAVLSACASTAREVPMESRLIVAVAGIAKAPQGSWDDVLVADLVKTNRLRVIERARLDTLLKENELSLSALSDAKVRPKMLAVLGADAVLLVDVADIRQYSGRTDDKITGWWSDVSLGIELKLAARLVSVSSGEVLAASSSSGRAEAGKFSGATGVSVVEKGREELVADAMADALRSLARSIARSAPAKT